MVKFLKRKVMPKQRGIIKLDGTIGDITFYRTKDGYMAREKGGISAQRMQTDPAFERTRENMAEFGRAGQAGKYLRNSVKQLIKGASDSRMQNRMTRAMMKVIHLDSVNPRGKRNVIDGEAELLQGFEFNAGSPLETSFTAPLTITLDRATGDANISIAPFVPQVEVTAQPGTTHFKLVAGAADINFETGDTVAATSESTMLPFIAIATTAIELENALPAASVNPLFLFFGISFYQEVNGFYYPLKNGAFNALRIVRVSGTP